MDYYSEIKNKLIDNEVYSAVKDYSKNKHDLETRYEVGKLLAEAGKHYGENIIGEYAKKLVVEVNKKYSPRTLRSMRQFYLQFDENFWRPLVSKLNWSHFLLLMQRKNINEINYYIEQVEKRKLTKRGLEDLIKSKEYERLDEDTKTKLIKKEDVGLKDMVPNPILIKNSRNVEVIKENVLKKLVLEDIPHFLKQLGDGFTFIDTEYRIKIGERYNYIDILLFNIEFNCYVLVELKVTEVKKDHIGQIEVYMNYIDKNVKNIYHDKTIGIILCKKDDGYMVEYSSDPRIIVRTYILI